MLLHMGPCSVRAEDDPAPLISPSPMTAARCDVLMPPPLHSQKIFDVHKKKRGKYIPANRTEDDIFQDPVAWLQEKFIKESTVG